MCRYNNKLPLQATSILKTSLGSFCGPHPFSNSLDCGDICRLGNEDLQALRDAQRDEPSEICLKTYPCSTPCGDDVQAGDRRNLTHDGGQDAGVYLSIDWVVALQNVTRVHTSASRNIAAPVHVLYVLAMKRLHSA